MQISINNNMRKKSLYFFIVPLLCALIVAIILHIAITKYFIHQTKEDVLNILLSNRGFHQYIQKVMHPAFFDAVEHGYIAKDFYAPKFLSSTYIVRNMHVLYNEEREKNGRKPIYYKMAANNPRNPVNRADEREAKLIKLFNENLSVKEDGEVVTVNGEKYLHYAIPFMKNEQRCLRCHGHPEDAPTGLRAMYPGEGGFHEKLGEIRAIESIRVPIKEERYLATMLTGSVGSGLFALILLFFFNSGLRQRVNEKTRNLEAEIAERKKAENMLQAIIEAEPECVKLLDENGNLIMMNRAGLAMLEVDSFEQVKGQCVCPFVGSEYLDSFKELTRKVFRGESGELLFEMTGVKGKCLWLETHAVPFRNDKNEIVALLGVTRNVTERRQAEISLAEEKERLSVTLRSIGDGVIVTDVDGNITLLNRVGEELTGWSSDKAIGQYLTKVFNIINETTREVCENPVEKVIRTGMIVGLANHTALIKKDGTEIIIADSGAPIRDRDSNIIGVALVFRDITAQYRMEQEMQKMEKLESLGVLAGGLAHDFNNLLTSVIGNISLAKMTIGIDHKSFGRLTEAEKAAQRATDLTHQLLTFAKGGAPIKKVASIADIVKEAVTFALSGSSVNCVYSIPVNLWNTEVDKGQMTQVFNNLIINAIHAMPNGGTVHIALENISIAAEEVFSLNAGDYVRITFRDEGIGIPEQYLARIFEPYYTTRKTGSGLGLSTVFSVLKRHEGHIAVKSEVGVGTTFNIYIPALKDSVSPECEAVQGIKPGKGRILIMDDELLIRNVSGEILSALGYEVEFAKDGKEAIDEYKKAKNDGNPFDLVIMDLTIPGGMGGKEAVAKLHLSSPEAKVIVSSGYSVDPIMSEYKKYGFSGVISKPYNANQVSEAINKILEGSS
jgi:PAS domain S-box-containing protein